MRWRPPNTSASARIAPSTTDGVAPCDSRGTALNYDVISEAVSTIRCEEELSAGWKSRIEEDFENREDD